MQGWKTGTCGLATGFGYHGNVYLYSSLFFYLVFSSKKQERKKKGKKQTGGATLLMGEEMSAAPSCGTVRRKLGHWSDCFFPTKHQQVSGQWAQIIPCTFAFPRKHEMQDANMSLERQCLLGSTSKAGRYIAPCKKQNSTHSPHSPSACGDGPFHKPRPCCKSSCSTRAVTTGNVMLPTQNSSTTRQLAEVCACFT